MGVELRAESCECLVGFACDTSALQQFYVVSMTGREAEGKNKVTILVTIVANSARLFTYVITMLWIQYCISVQ